MSKTEVIRCLKRYVAREVFAALRTADEKVSSLSHRRGRLRYDCRTREYMRRRTGEGMSKTEVIRCLKRYVAREVFAALRTADEKVARAA